MSLLVSSVSVDQFRSSSSSSTFLSVSIPTKVVESGPALAFASVPIVADIASNSVPLVVQNQNAAAAVPASGDIQNQPNLSAVPEFYEPRSRINSGGGGRRGRSRNKQQQQQQQQPQQ